ncbi:unnamed protein product, partial [Oikopleura dioica]
PEANGPEGPGVARNSAAKISNGEYFALQDVDDEMHSDRMALQFKALEELRKNGEEDTRVLTSHGPTIAMPTWFFHRSVYERQGGLSEIGRGFPEDQLFLLRHIYEFSGIIKRVSAPLVLYRFHEECMSLGVSEKSIWTMRLDYLEKHYLSRWKSFTIWSAGKQGRRLFRDLATASQEKVIAFCDVDEKKIETCIKETTKRPKPKIPIIHFSQAVPPLVIALKTDLHEGGLEKNIDSLGLLEGVDYVHFG